MELYNDAATTFILNNDSSLLTIINSIIYLFIKLYFALPIINPLLMYMLRLITFAVFVTGLCGCSTTYLVNFDDHLNYDDNFQPIKNKSIPGLKMPKSAINLGPKLRELYKRKKLDVRLEDNILAVI